MKGIALLIVGLVLLLAAAGGGYYVYTTYISPPESGEPKEPPPPPPPPPIFVRVPPLVIPMIGAERPEQHINIVVSLQVTDPAIASRIQGEMTHVSDLLLTTLYGAVDEGSVLMQGDVLDLVKVKKVLRRALNKRFGAGAVKEVLVQTVLQRHL